MPSASAPPSCASSPMTCARRTRRSSPCSTSAPAEDEAGQQVYRQIEQQVRRALGLTDAFVQLAKAESDAYRFEACMFTMLAMDAADQLWPLAQQKDIDLRRDWDDEQEPMVWADPACSRARCSTCWRMRSSTARRGPSSA